MNRKKTNIVCGALILIGVLILVGIAVTLFTFSSPESFGMTRGVGGYSYDNDDYQEYLCNESCEEHSTCILEGQEKQRQADDFSEQVINISLYKEWLCGYLVNGGKITHQYNYSTKMEFGRWEIVRRNTTFADGIQPSETNIIVLEGARLTVMNDTSGEPLGPNSIFFMDNFTHEGDWVPMYTDINCSI